jgi:hypothetical protein
MIVESELDGWLVQWEFARHEGGSPILVGLQIVRPVEMPPGGLTMRTLRTLTMHEAEAEARRQFAQVAA